MIAMSRPPFTRLVLLLSAPLAALLLGGCAARKSTDSLFGLITPYRIDICLLYTSDAADE